MRKPRIYARSSIMLPRDKGVGNVHFDSNAIVTFVMRDGSAVDLTFAEEGECLQIRGIDHSLDVQPKSDNMIHIASRRRRR